LAPAKPSFIPWKKREGMFCFCVFCVSTALTLFKERLKIIKKEKEKTKKRRIIKLREEYFAVLNFV
jgi:hypothetical protein